jgi:hypothetical protein
MTRPEPVHRRVYRRKSFRFVAAGTALAMLGLGVSHAAGAASARSRHSDWWHKVFATAPIGAWRPGLPVVKPPAAKPPAAKPPVAKPAPTSTSAAPPPASSGGAGGGAGGGGNAPTAGGAQTVGTGSLSAPAQGPGVEFADRILTSGEKPVLVKNWDFGADGTIKNIADMNGEFVYHDQFNTIGNGDNYGAITAAPDKANAISGQPVEDSAHKVRAFTGDSLQTFLVPKNAGAQTVNPKNHDVLNGSFQPKFTLPAGGSRLKHEIVWQTRVKYVVPPEFWFALWNSGNQWDKGAEFDVVESFGFDNTGAKSDKDDGKQEDRNFNGRWWHSDPVGAKSEVDYGNFASGMRDVGAIKGDKNPNAPALFDATAYHTWTLVYRTDDSFSFYVDGTEAQHGKMNWTLGGGAGGKNIDFHFLFDASWGHTKIDSVDYDLPAKDLVGKFYDFDYSRVYETP